MVYCAPVIVPFPVGIDQVVTITAPPGLSEINVRGDRGTTGFGDNARIGPAEAAIQESRVVGDVVH